MWNSLMPNRQNKFTTSRISKRSCIKQMHQSGKTMYIDNWKWLQPISRYRLILCESVGLNRNNWMIYNARKGECEGLLESKWKPQTKRPFGARWLKPGNKTAIFVRDVQQNRVTANRSLTWQVNIRPRWASSLISLLSNISSVKHFNNVITTKQLCNKLTKTV